MGNAGSGALPYDIGERVGEVGSAAGASTGWALHNGKRRQDGAPVSVLRFDKRTASPGQREMAENMVKRMKTLRHPHILAYKDGMESDAEINVVTDKVVPLDEWIRKRRDTDESSAKLRMAVSWGFHCVLQALGFINEDCKLFHGCVSPEAIFVTSGGDWKLGGLFLCSEPDHGGGASKLLRDNPSLVESKYRAPERQQSKFAMMTPTGTDIFGLGCVLFECFNGLNSAADISPDSPGQLPSQLHKPFQLMVADGPGSRPSAKKLLTHPGFKWLFRNKLFSTFEFMAEFQLKSQPERVSFVQELSSNLGELPQPESSFKTLSIVIEILTSPAQPGQPANPLHSVALPPFLQAVSLVKDSDEFQRVVMPVVIELFSSNDRATRVVLLQQLGKFLDHFDPKVLNGKIFNNICTGFKDSAPILREMTVKSVVALAPKLDAKNLNETLLRHLILLLKDQEPAIRTNTLICLNKIIDLLNDEMRKKVALSSFPQATRDQFVPARQAALRGLNASLKYVEDDSQALAGKVIPSLAFALVDPSVEVRQLAFGVLDRTVGKLREQSDARAVKQKKEEEEALRREREGRRTGEIRPDAAATKPPAAAPGAGSVLPLSGDAAGYLSAAAGWAGSFTKGWREGESSSTSGAASSPPRAAATTNTSSSSSSSTASSSQPPASGLTPSSAARGSTSTKSAVDAALEEDFLGAPSGWGDDDEDLIGFGDDDTSAKAKPPLAKPATITIAPPKSGLTVRRAGSSSGGHVSVHGKESEDDFFGSQLSSGSKAPALAAASPADRRAAAQKKREEARQRMAQRKKVAVVKKASEPSGDGDDWDNW